MDAICSLTYWSRAVRPMEDAELLQLLDTARAANARRGVSGMLLYKSGCFLQVLEGETAVVEALIAKIARDTRHEDVRILRRDSGPRQFGEWSMGFQNLSDLRLVEAGESDLMSVPFDAEYFGANPTKVQELLLCFRGMSNPALVTTLV